MADGERTWRVTYGQFQQIGTGNGTQHFPLEISHKTTQNYDRYWEM